MIRLVYIIFKSILLANLLLLPLITKAQYVIKEADAEFERYNFSKAATLYTNAYHKKKSLKAVERLAECYRLMRNFKESESWYAILITMDGAKPEAWHGYAEMLKSNAKYAEAKSQFAKYASFVAKPTATELSRFNTSLAACDSALAWIKNPKQLLITNETKLNGPQSDWAAVKHRGNTVFTSDRPSNESNKLNPDKPFLKLDTYKSPHKNISGWTGSNYLQLYQQGAGQGATSVFPLPQSSNYHIGAASFNQDGNEIFFAVTQIPVNLKVADPVNTVHIQIYSSTYANGLWAEHIPFPYNNLLNWSAGDPFLAADSVLYFVSDKPGGKGGTDIYYTNRMQDGSWQEPVNLASVNTPANERSPVVHKNNFYFASEGRVGMGGLDIFKGTMNQIGSVADITNLGYPINSARDDFSLFLTEDKKGYFASNRDGGKGSDDIYSFTERKQLLFNLQGKVFNRETNQPLANAIVNLTNTTGAAMQSIQIKTVVIILI